MALAANRHLPEVADTIEYYPKAFPVEAGEVIYEGAIVAVDGDGFLMPCSDTSGLEVVGIADEKVDNTDGADGALSCRVKRGVFLIPCTSITQAMVGDVMEALDDETVDDASGSGTTNNIAVGPLVGLEDTTHGWVRILGITA